MAYISLIIGAVLVGIDQLIKFFVSVYLQPVEKVNVIGDIFKLTYVENRGVAFGMFSDMRWVFVVLTVALLAIIIIYMFKKKPQGKFFYICSALIIGGGVGNLIDRVFYGYVIDYLSLSFFPPVCNFADYCITAGTVLLMVYLLFFSDAFSKRTELKND